MLCTQGVTGLTSVYPIVYPRGRTPPPDGGRPWPFDLREDFGRTRPNGSDEPSDQKAPFGSVLGRAYIQHA